MTTAANQASPYFISRNECPVCMSARFDTLFDAPYTDERVKGHVLDHYSWQGAVRYDLLNGIDYRLLECSNCSLIFQQMVPVGEMLRIIYDEFIEPGKQYYHEMLALTLDSYYETSALLCELFVYSGKRPTEICFLDYGFGFGRSARVAVALGAQVYATEISPEKIKFAQTLGVKIVSDDDISKMAFDIILAESVLEHVVERRAIFHRRASALAPGGVLKIGVPRQKNIRKLLRQHGMIDWSPWTQRWKRRRFNAYNTILPLEHIQSFSPKAIKHLAGSAGMAVVNGGWAWNYVNVDIGSPVRLIRSTRSWGKRLTKGAYAALPGLKDTGYYLLRR